MNAYELQLFDNESGQYVPIATGTDPLTLMDQAKSVSRRVINAFRGNENYSPKYGKGYAKPLPLKPKIPYGLSGKTRKYGNDTMIEPADVETLAKRALEHYEMRAKRGEKNIPVYVWADSAFAQAIHILKARPETYNIIELNPDEYL